MNYLLWQAEFFGSPVPPLTIAKRMLDPEQSISHFDIYHHGDWRQHHAPIGSFTWLGQVYDQNGRAIQLDNRIRKVGGYGINWDSTPPETTGTVELPGGQQLAFDLDLDFDAQLDWRAFIVTLGSGRPGVADGWDLKLNSNSTSQKIAFTLRNSTGTTNTVEKTFAQLQTSKARLETATWLVTQSMGIQNQWTDYLLATLFGSGDAASPTLARSSSALEWEGRYAMLPDYSPRLRVYRLRAPVMGSQEIVAYIGRGGELLRAHIPVVNVDILNRQYYPQRKPRE